MAAQETMDAELVALAALVFMDAALVTAGASSCAPDLNTYEQLAYRMRERGILSWPAVPEKEGG